MNFRKKLLLGATLVPLLAGSLFSAPALAAGAAYSLTTSPVFLDLPIKPGTSSTNTLQVMNNTSTAVNITMQVQVFSAAANQSGLADIYNAPSNDPAPSWVHFSPASFVAQPNVWESTKMTIDIPTTAQLGYYYAVIFKPSTPGQLLTTTGNNIKGSNAILVLVDTQSGNEKRQMQVSNFSVSKKLYEYLPATFNVTVANTGNIFIPPTGDIFISKNSNLTNTIATLPVNAAQGNVLPNSTRSFSATWSDGFPVYQPKMVDGQPVVVNNKTVYQLHWNFAQANKLRIGKYYAELALIYDNGSVQIPINSVVSFWVIPWKIIGIFIVVLLLVLAGFWAIGRSIVRRIRKFRKK